MDDNPTISPVPVKKTTLQQYSFPDAVRELLSGRRMTRLEWNTNDTYIVIKDGLLKLVKGDITFDLLVQESDMSAIDWITLPEPNILEER